MNWSNYFYYMFRSLKIILFNPYEDRERKLIISTIKNYYTLKSEPNALKNE